MKFGRIRNYPLWQELPAVLAFLTILFLSLRFWSQLPEPMACHFDGNGDPNGYMSRVMTLAIIVGSYIMCWLIDSVARYQCLLSESEKKRFNWLQFVMWPFLVLSPLCWALLIDFNINGGPFKIPGASWLGFSLLGWAYLYFTERSRKAGDRSTPMTVVKSELEGELPEKFCIVVKEAPVWWVAVCLISGLLTLASAYACLGTESINIFLVATLALSGLILISFSGGYRFIVHHRGVDIFLGLGIPLKSLSIGQITGAEVKPFSALQDFGGWGIRFGRDKTTAYIVGGEVGVLVKTEGRNYLLATDQAATLSQALNQVLGRESAL